MNLAEHTTCNYLYQNVNDLISSVRLFCSSNLAVITEIREEIDVFVVTPTIDDEIADLRQNASQYLIKLGTNVSSDSSEGFLDDFKELYNSSEVLQNNTQLNNILGITDERTIDDISYTPREFIYGVNKSMISGSLEKIAAAYDYSEFIIASNLFILINNLKASDITDKLDIISSSSQYVTDSCPYLIDQLEDIQENLSDALDSVYLTSTGEVDLDTLLDGLSEDSKNDIYKILRTLNVIMNNIINEIKIKTNQKKIYLDNFTIPSKYVPPPSDNWWENGGDPPALTGLLPEGGTTGQVLTKLSDDDYDANWQDPAGGSGLGDVVGPASATDNAVARFNSTTGKLIQNSTVTIGDTGNIAGVADLSASGNISGANLSGTNTGDETASGILSKLATVDGTGSGLDADLLDGHDASYFQVAGTYGDVVGPASSTNTAVAVFDGTTGKLLKNSGIFIDSSDNITGVQDLEINGLLAAYGGGIFTDTLFIGSDVATTSVAVLNGDNSSIRGLLFSTAASPRIGLITQDTESGSETGSGLYIATYDDLGEIQDYPIVIERDLSTPVTFYRNIIATNLSGTNTGDETASGILSKLATVDGTGSGLDADLLDGHDASYFQIAGSYQPLDSTLTSLSSLGTASDKIAYTTGVDTWAETSISSFARTLLDDADAGAMRTTLELDGDYGDVVGPSSATNNAIARYDTTTGKLIKNSSAILSDNGDLSLSNSTSSISIDVSGYSAEVSGNSMSFSSARDVEGSELKLELSDTVLSIISSAFDGSSNLPIAQMDMVQNATVTDVDKVSGKFIFKVRMDGYGGLLSTRMIIDEDGITTSGFITSYEDIMAVGSLKSGQGYDLVGVTLSDTGDISARGTIIGDGIIQAGKSANAGTFKLYPGTSSSGITTITMSNNAGNTTTNINVAAQAGARTLTIPDPGASASFVMTEGTQTINGAKTFGSTITGSISGNSGTATILQTSRNINGVSFNGSADITVTAAAGTLTGTTLNSTVVTSSLTSVGTLGSLDVSGNSTLSSIDIGGGYGSTGATISSAGVGQFNGALTTDGALTAASAMFGGGYTTSGSGCTISSTGAISTNDSITSYVDGQCLIRGFGFQNSSNFVGFNLNGSRGTESSQLIVAANDYNTINNYMYDGSTYRLNAQIRIGVVDGTPGSSDMPGGFEFNTCADGGITLEKAFALRQNKNAEFYGTLDVTGNTTLTSVDIGGGYGSSGCTINSAGQIAADGDIFCGNNTAAARLFIVSNTSNASQIRWYNGSTTANAGLRWIAQADATNFNWNLYRYIAGAYQDPAISVENSTGNVTIDNVLSVTGNTILASVDIGGGYGSTGVTISSGGNIAANGYIYADGAMYCTTPAAGTNSTIVATTAFVTSAASYSTYYTLMNVGGSHTAGKVAGTYALGYGNVAAVGGTGTLYPIGIIGIYSADFPSVNGLSAKLRIRAQVNCNDVAPTGNYTFGLYPITRPGTSGGAGLCIYTIGTVVSGSNGATVSTPAADSQNSLVGSDFSLPSDGQYIIAVVTTGTVAASAHVHLNAQLQVHYA